MYKIYTLIRLVLQKNLVYSIFLCNINIFNFKLDNSVLYKLISIEISE